MSRHVKIELSTVSEIMRVLLATEKMFQKFARPKWLVSTATKLRCGDRSRSCSSCCNQPPGDRLRPYLLGCKMDSKRLDHGKLCAELLARLRHQVCKLQRLISRLYSPLMLASRITRA